MLNSLRCCNVIARTACTARLCLRKRDFWTLYLRLPFSKQQAAKTKHTSKAAKQVTQLALTFGGSGPSWLRFPLKCGKPHPWMDSSSPAQLAHNQHALLSVPCHTALHLLRSARPLQALCRRSLLAATAAAATTVHTSLLCTRFAVGHAQTRACRLLEACTGSCAARTRVPLACAACAAALPLHKACQGHAHGVQPAQERTCGRNQRRQHPCQQLLQCAASGPPAPSSCSLQGSTAPCSVRDAGFLQGGDAGEGSRDRVGPHGYAEDGDPAVPCMRARGRELVRVGRAVFAGQAACLQLKMDVQDTQGLRRHVMHVHRLAHASRLLCRLGRKP